MAFTFCFENGIQIEIEVSLANTPKILTIVETLEEYLVNFKNVGCIEYKDSTVYDFDRNSLISFIADSF